MEKNGHLHVKYLNPALSDHCSKKYFFIYINISIEHFRLGFHANTTKKTKQRRRRPYIKTHYFASTDTYLNLLERVDGLFYSKVAGDRGRGGRRPQ